MDSAYQNQPMGHLRPSVVVIVLRLLSALFMLNMLSVGLLLGFFALNNLHDWHASYIYALVLLALVNLGLLSTMVIQLFSSWAGRNYYLIGHHLIERLGILNITEKTHELSQVKSVVASQTWLGRRLNFGTIKLSFAGTSGDREVIIYDITDPSTYKRYFDEHLQVQGWVR